MRRCPAPSDSGAVRAPSAHAGRLPGAGLLFLCPIGDSPSETRRAVRRRRPSRHLREKQALEIAGGKLGQLSRLEALHPRPREVGDRTDLGGLARAEWRYAGRTEEPLLKLPSRGIRGSAAAALQSAIRGSAAAEIRVWTTRFGRVRHPNVICAAPVVTRPPPPGLLQVLALGEHVCREQEVSSAAGT